MEYIHNGTTYGSRIEIRNEEQLLREVRKCRKSGKFFLAVTGACIPYCDGPGWVWAYALYSQVGSGALLNVWETLWCRRGREPGSRVSVLPTPACARTMRVPRSLYEEVKLASSESRRHLVSLRASMLEAAGVRELPHKNRVVFKRPPACTDCTPKRPCRLHKDN